MNIDLSNKVAFVTGGSKGIGKSIVKTLAKCGANVVLMSRNPQEIKEVADEINTAGGGKALGIAGDVSIPEDIEAAIKQTIATFGKLDLAVNNAGIVGETGFLHESTAENWQEVFQINVAGIFYAMKYEIIEMLKAGGGSIVNMASVESHMPLRNFPVYTASKHALIGLTKTAAVDYADKGIRINSVSPGVIWTRLIEGLGDKYVSMFKNSIPLGRIGTGEDIANTVAFLLSDLSAYTTSSDFLVDGGFNVRGLFHE
jgi:NAD(P)-dependent dehydrogenase (short-subunit alcohol dehydrogenase family)